MADRLDLSIGDSDMILVNALKENPNDVYCDREVVEGKWPPTSDERQANPNATYSRASIQNLLMEEEITDRRISRHSVSGGVLFKKI